MDSSQLLGITTFAYLFCTLLYVGVIVFKSRIIGTLATWATIASWLLQTFAIGLRWVESYQMGIGHAPLTNMYESVVFFAWTIVLLYIGIEFRFKTKLIGAFAIPFSFLAMAYGSFSAEINKEISPLIPALQSNWLIAHVVTCFVGYAAFAVAAGLGVMYLIKQGKNDSQTGRKKNASVANVDHRGLHLPALDSIDDMIHKAMIFGFIWLSGGIITGAVWANSAWGTYWSWDPKETWSLITWFFYAITLHARYTRGWSGKKIAVLALVGFIAVLFTYYGVNFLLAGLHSYGSN